MEVSAVGRADALFVLVLVKLDLCDAIMRYQPLADEVFYRLTVLVGVTRPPKDCETHVEVGRVGALIHARCAQRALDEQTSLVFWGRVLNVFFNVSRD